MSHERARSSKENHPAVSSNRHAAIPTGAILILVTVVCVSLALSAGYGYYTLSYLRAQYLQSRAREIASTIDVQARGPGRRSNPSFWQRLIEDNFDSLGSAAAFFKLVDSSGRVLAEKSRPGFETAALPSAAARSGILVFEFPLMAPGQSQMGMAPMIAGWRLRIGICASAADFVTRQAILQLVVTGAAIVLLSGLSYLLLRMLRRFVALQLQEYSDRRLKSLGVMAATLAHEIRNPLGAVKGLTQLAQEGLPAAHETQALMKTVVTEAERLEKLVADLLTFASFKRAEIQEFDYIRLVGEVKTALEANQKEKRDLEVITGLEHLPILSDENGLRQVLLNVLLNALDFTPRDGRVAIRIRTEKVSNSVVTEIDDCGPGIGARDSEELFEPFITTKAKGTGLGLAVSRQIVESLGGTISLGNLPTGGARCTICLPEIAR